MMTRRDWMWSASGAAALTAGRAGSSWAAEAAKVKITGFEIYTVHVNTRAWVVFKLLTDAALTGLGEATHSGAIAVSVARDLFEVIRGRSPFEIERLRQAAIPKVFAADSRDKRPNAAAFAGLEQCMWDLQGKALGVPCYQLLGGKLRDETRNYANINRMTRGDERTPEGFARNAQRAVDGGFDAFKLAPFDHMRREEADPARYERDSDLGVQMAEGVREVVGSDRDLLLDAHSRFTQEQALDIAGRLEHLNLFWLEEVARSTDILAAVNRQAKMPTAGGESLFGVREFFPYLKAGAVDIVMPDVKFCGGMLELKKIAAMAGASGVQTSPHGPASPIGNMAAAHVCVTMPNFQILEFAFGEVPWRAECVEPAESIVNGRLKVSETPGIGYELASDRWQKFEG